MIPARIEAKRRNAQKSRGPRTARGKAQSHLGGLQQGRRSPLHRLPLVALFHAEPGAVEAAAQAVLTPGQARHPVLAREVEVACEAEIGLPEQLGKGGREKSLVQISYVQSLNVIENKRRALGKSLDVIEREAVRYFASDVTENKPLNTTQKDLL